MKRSVHLFIGGMEVEFKTQPDILYNFRIDDTTSPAAVKNSYSKTITIPSTRNNDKIFDNFFNNDYRTTGTNFDAGKKTEFSIYIDSELYETGYCKLDKVRQNKHYYEYDVTLYGGLGEFFYNLSYKDAQAGEDEKMKLSDLDFGVDLGFAINKETVKDAWDNIGIGKWGILNFGVAYNGLPDDFDSDKVLMNLSTGGSGGRPDGWHPRPGTDGRYAAPVVTSVTVDDKTYETYGGYAIAELSREYTEAEMRDFRSYLQRPVLNVSKVIEAICNPENNGGYEVSLDPEWFSNSNKYWKSLWVTMPMLSTLDYVTKEEETGVTVSIGAKETGTLSSGDPGYFEDYLVNVGNNDSDKAFDLSVSVKLDIEGVSDSSHNELVVCAYSQSQSMYYPSAMLVQLVAYDAFGRPVAGSPVQYITTAYGARRSADGRSSSSYFIDYGSWTYSQPYGNEYSTAGGTCFQQKNGSTYRWDDTLTMTAPNVPAGSTIKLLVTEIYKNGNRPAGAKKVFYKTPGQNTFSAYTFSNFNVELIGSKVTYKTGEGIRTGVEFTKKQLLDTDYSPCDFLLSYAKIFGLYFLKDPIRKKISILTRKNFFDRSEVKDINEYIDRQSVEVTPIAFNTKWYDWNLEADEGEYADAYEKTYGKPYGNAKINVNYNFNRDTTEVLDGNIFKGAVQVLERSAAFCYVGEDTIQKSWQFPGYSYLLFNDTDATDTYEVEVKPSSTIDAYRGFEDGYLYYDMFDKVQLHTENNSPADGNNVLLLYNGTKSFQIGSTKIKYILSDDNSYMSVLNDGRPCWLYSTTTGDSQGNDICIFLNGVPHFSRFFESGGMINKSLDFGKPDEVYVPGLYYGEESTLYNQFWGEYISDLYDKDSRILRTKMLIKGKPTIDWLRCFYVFDNALWRMTEISDYNISQDKLSTVEFIRVQDISKYTSSIPEPVKTITLALSTDVVSQTGGTISYTATTESGVTWYLQGPIQTTLMPSSGTGTQSGTIVIPSNPGGNEKTLTFTVVSPDDSDSKSVSQSSYIFWVYRTDSGDELADSGGTLPLKVICTSGAWTAKTDYGAIVTAFSPSSGSATTVEGVDISATVAPNGYSGRRSFSIYIENEFGQKAFVYAQQNGAGNPYINFTPPYITNAPADYTTYNVYVEANRQWTATNAYPSICHTDTLAGTGNTTIQVVVEPNTSEDLRFGSILFYLDGDSSTYSFTVSQQGKPEPAPTGNYFYFYNTNDGSTGTTSDDTIEWYAAGNYLTYRTNATSISIDTGGADWITGIDTGTTAATVYVTTNTTGAVRSTTLTWTVTYSGGTSETYYSTLRQYEGAAPTPTGNTYFYFFDHYDNQITGTTTALTAESRDTAIIVNYRTNAKSISISDGGTGKVSHIRTGLQGAIVGITANDTESVFTIPLTFSLTYSGGTTDTRYATILQDPKTFFWFIDPATQEKVTTIQTEIVNDAATIQIPYSTSATAITISEDADWITAVDSGTTSAANITVTRNSGFPRTATLTWSVYYKNGHSETYQSTLRQKGPLGSA